MIVEWGYERLTDTKNLNTLQPMVKNMAPHLQLQPARRACNLVLSIFSVFPVGPGCIQQSWWLRGGMRRGVLAWGAWAAAGATGAGSCDCRSAHLYSWRRAWALTSACKWELDHVSWTARTWPSRASPWGRGFASVIRLLFHKPSTNSAQLAAVHVCHRFMASWHGPF